MKLNWKKNKEVISYVLGINVLNNGLPKALLFSQVKKKK